MCDFDKQQPSPQQLGGKSPKQWTLAALLFLTTLIAVAASGYSRGEKNGLLIALFSFWFMILGLACIVYGITSRLSEKFFLLAIGIVMVGLGMYAFATFPYW